MISGYKSRELLHSNGIFRDTNSRVSGGVSEWESRVRIRA